jgi:uncharacterized membrane protein
MFLGKVYRWVMNRLRKDLVTGIVVSLPVLATIFLVKFMINSIDRLAPLKSETFFGFHIPGFGLAIIIVALIGVGILVRLYIIGLLVRLGDYLASQIPFVKTVYVTIKQMVASMVSDRSESFRRAVLVPFPHQDMWALAFQTGSQRPGEQLFDSIVTEGDEQRLISVFVPTTPNPTSGYYLLIEESKVRFPKMTVEEALTMVVSAGVIKSRDVFEEIGLPGKDMVDDDGRARRTTKPMVTDPGEK